LAPVADCKSRQPADGRVADAHVVGRDPDRNKRLPLQSVAGWLEGYRMFWGTSLETLKRNLEEK